MSAHSRGSRPNRPQQPIQHKKAKKHGHSSCEGDSSEEVESTQSETTSKRRHKEESDVFLYHERAAFWKVFNKLNALLTKPLPEDIFEGLFSSLDNHKIELFRLAQKAIESIFEKFEVFQDDWSTADKFRMKQILEAWNSKDTIHPIMSTNTYYIFAALKTYLYAKLSPSTFAKSAGWVSTQQGPAAIDCLRPSTWQGLPVVLLHPAFAKFTHLLEEALPYDEESALATEVAHKLCLTMPDHFVKEEERINLFHCIIRPFFADEFTSVSYGSAHPVASVLDSSGVYILLEEHKNEPGASGDVYMQGSSSFDAAARSRPISEQQQTGCPAFIICIDGKRTHYNYCAVTLILCTGPNILICGGFRDGYRSAVEPLSTWCIMMPDHRGVRQGVLARHLYALKMALLLLTKRA